MKSKSTKIYNKYKIMDPEVVQFLLRKDDDWQKRQAESSSPLIFVILTDKRFHNWMVCIESIHQVEGKLKFAYSICRVPKEVTDTHIEKMRRKLNFLMKNVFNDILENAAKIAARKNSETE